MSLPTRIEAYDDCLDIFDQALADPDGARVKFATYPEAQIFQLRMHQARALQRDQNARIYPPDDARHGRAGDFEKLTVRRPREDTKGCWWIYVERWGAHILEVEPLSEVIDTGLVPTHED